jgi:hypothetical protein
MGLIIPQYHSEMDYQVAVPHENKPLLPMTYQNERWILVPKVPSPERQEIRMTGVAFSRAGKELLTVVDVDPKQDYTSALTSFLGERGTMLTKIQRT